MGANLMARYDCPRCEVKCFTTDPPHLCKDVAARLKRREQQKQAVLTILLRDTCTANCQFIESLAEDIVKKLSQLGVEND